MQFGSDMDGTVPPRPLWPVPWKKHGHKPTDVIPAARENELRQQKKIILEELLTIHRIDSAEIDAPIALEGGRLRREITLVGNPWKSCDQAARQLGNLQYRGPRRRFYHGYYDLTLDGTPDRTGHLVKARLPTHPT